MAFKLSSRSLGKLEGVHPDMVETVKKAIEVTKVDFGVTYGVRDLAEQERLFKSGRSQTMKSKHLIQDTGYSHAVDLVAYDGSDVVWEINVYDDIADAMALAYRCSRDISSLEVTQKQRSVMDMLLTEIKSKRSKQGIMRNRSR